MKKIVDKPSPITGGLLELCTESTSVVFRGETIFYERSFYHCVESDFEFTDEEQTEANLKNVYDAYRRLHSIPLAEELRLWRERYGIPASAMSILLNLGENQYSLYEDGAVPTPSIGRLLSMVRDPAFVREMLEASRPSFSEKLYAKYYKAIISSMQPAKYEADGVYVMDYGHYHSFPSAKIETSKTTAPVRRRSSYMDFEYAAAC